MNTPIRFKKRAIEDDALAWRILGKCTSVTLSLSEPDGAPYGVVVSHALVGKTLYFHCARAGRKLDILQQNPRACVTGVLAQRPRPDFDVDYISVTAFGQATPVEDLGELRRGLIAICEKHCPGMDFEPTLQADSNRVALWRIELSEATAKAQWPEPVTATVVEGF